MHSSDIISIAFYYFLLRYNYSMFFIILFLLIVFLYRCNLKILKNKYTYTLIALSAVWWVFLLYNQLTTTLVCSPDDEFCNSGNTVSGDIVWGTWIALLSLSLIWMPYILVMLLVAARKRQKSKNHK